MLKSIRVKDYLIRDVTIDDYFSINNVLFKSWMDTYPNEEFNIRKEDIEYKFEKKLQPEELSKWKERFLKMTDKEKFNVLEISGQIVGMCKCSEENNINQLQAIYLLPEFYGRGLGYILWEKTKKVFNPSKDVIVHVASYNERAIGFYKKLGFESTEKILFDEKHKMRNGAIIPELEMIIKNK